MTIQTDLQEIEKGCGKIFSFYTKESMCYINLECGKWKEITSTWNKMEWCELCEAKRQTFITENLKRINEMIKFFDNFAVLNEHCRQCEYNRKFLIYKIEQLKADKKFLEEKRNGN